MNEFLFGTVPWTTVSTSPLTSEPKPHSTTKLLCDVSHTNDHHSPSGHSWQIWKKEDGKRNERRLEWQQNQGTVGCSCQCKLSPRTMLMQLSTVQFLKCSMEASKEINTCQVINQNITPLIINERNSSPVQFSLMWYMYVAMMCGKERQGLNKRIKQLYSSSGLNSKLFFFLNKIAEVFAFPVQIEMHGEAATG